MRQALPVIVLVLSGAGSLFFGVEGLRAEAQGASAATATLESSPGTVDRAELPAAPEATPDANIDEPADVRSAENAADSPPGAAAPVVAPPAPAPAAPAADAGDGGCAPLNFYYRRGSAWPYERPDGESLRRFRALLDEHPAARLVVAGHADQSGARERNLDLSYRRAQRVFVDLGEAGFPAHRVMLQAAGDFVPVEGADRRAAVNRRVEVAIRGLPAGTCEGEE